MYLFIFKIENFGDSFRFNTKNNLFIFNNLKIDKN